MDGLGVEELSLDAGLDGRRVLAEFALDDLDDLDLADAEASTQRLKRGELVGVDGRAHSSLTAV